MIKKFLATFATLALLSSSALAWGGAGFGGLISGGGGGGGGSGDVVGPSSSVDSEVALFNGTTGKLLKSATITGLAKLTAGILSAAIAGTDYMAPYSVAETRYVSKSGNDANTCDSLAEACLTIQAAIDVITDNATDNRYMVLVYPGEYSENVVMEEYVSLYGVGDHIGTTITASSGVTVTMPPSSSAVNIRNLSIENTGNGGTAVLFTTGFGILYDVYVSWINSDNGASGTLADLQGGVFSMYGGKLRYNGGGDSVGAVTHEPVLLSGTSNSKFKGVVGDLDIEDVDDNLYAFSTDVTFTNDIDVENGEYLIDALNVAYSGNVQALRITDDIDSITVKNTSFLVSSAGNGVGTAVFLDSISNNKTISATSSIISVTGFTSNYRSDISNGDTILFGGNHVTAADVDTGAGTAVNNGCVINGDYYIDSDIHASYLEFDDAENTYIGLDKTYPTYFSFSNDVTNFWLGNTGDPNIWMNYEQDADIILGQGTGGDTDVIISEGDTNKTALNQDGTDFKIQPQNTNGNIVLEPSGTGGLDVNSPVSILEQAAADTDVAGYGQIWVKNETPNELWFTDDAGTDTQLGVGSFSWGASADGVTGNGLSLNDYGSATQMTADTNGLNIGDLTNTNTNSSFAFTGGVINVSNNAGTGINSGLNITTYEGDTTLAAANPVKGFALGINHSTVQGGGGGGSIGILGNNNSVTPNGIVRVLMTNSQSGASTLYSGDAGTSAQAHTVFDATCAGASTGQACFNADLSSTGTGKGFTATIPRLNTAQGYYATLNTSGSSATTPYLFNGEIPSSQINNGTVYRATVAQSPAANNEPKLAVWNATANTFANQRTLPYMDIDVNIENSNSTITNNYDTYKFTRTDRSTGAGSTLTASGSVMRFENVATQTLGTLTDTVSVLELVQDADSTGDLIYASADGGTTEIFSLSSSGVMTMSGTPTIFMDRYSADTSSASITGRKARGTQASPDAVDSGDLLYNLGARGYGATGFGGATALWAIRAAENFTDSAKGTKMTYEVTPTGGTSRVTALTIEASGAVTVPSAGLVTNAVTADPCGDTSAYPEGAQFYNDTSDYPCYCTGAGADLKFDGTTACF